MTPFEQALRKLAEREPEKFRVGNLVVDGTCVELFRGKKKFCEIVLSKITQDDLDEILALVGYEYDVVGVQAIGGRLKRYCDVRGDSPIWVADYWRKDMKDPYQIEVVTNEKGDLAEFKTKLDAAKGALIAVVEHLERKQ